MVRFTKAYANYGKGETAAFRGSHEQWLISQKIAERVEAPVTDSKTPPEPPPTDKTKDPNLDPKNRQTVVPAPGSKTK